MTCALCTARGGVGRPRGGRNQSHRETEKYATGYQNLQTERAGSVSTTRHRQDSGEGNRCVHTGRKYPLPSSQPPCGLRAVGAYLLVAGAGQGCRCRGRLSEAETARGDAAGRGHDAESEAAADGEEDGECTPQARSVEELI